MSVLANNVEDAFLTLGATIVFFMQAGFAFLEAGSVRSKNTTSILFKNLLDAVVGCVAYWAVGFAFAFGGGNGFIGTEHFFLSGIGLHSREVVRWMVQYVYVITAATIVSGAMAERTEFKSYLVFTFLCSGWVQPVVAHWSWSDKGWLHSGVQVESHNFTVRFEDFAGSGVIHVVGGTAALVGAAVIGPRIGRFDENGKSVRISAYTTTMATLGGFIILFGFFAFNLASHGSLSQVGDGSIHGLIAANCMLACSGGAITAALYKRCNERKHGAQWSLVATINGCLVGMVSVSASASTIYPYAAFIVGAVAGLIYIGVTGVMERWRIDDPLDAVAVHLGGGAWGVLAVPFLDANIGVFYKANRVSFTLLGWNLCGLVVIFVWTFAWSGIAFGLMSWLHMLRVPAEVERRGLDVVVHGRSEKAYAYQGIQQRQRGSSIASLAAGLSGMFASESNEKPTTVQFMDKSTRRRESQGTTPTETENACEVLENSVAISTPTIESRGSSLDPESIV